MKTTFHHYLFEITLFILLTILLPKGSLQAQTLPDYIVDQADVAPTTIIADVTQVYTYCKIKNIGDGNGYYGDTELRLYVNQDYASTTGTGFGMTYYSTPLAPGFSSDVISITNTINLPAGDYYMVFKVSMPESSDEESNTSNNIAYKAITILSNITAEADANGSVSGLKTTGYSKGETVSLVAVPNVGCEFVNWTEGNTIVSTSSTLEFAASTNRALRANFKKKTFTVSVSSNPTAAGQDNLSATYEYGTSVTLTASPNANYYIVNWTINCEEVSTGSTYTFTVTENTSIVVNYKKCYTIALSSSGDGSGTITGNGIYDENATVTIKATPNENSTFVGWYNGSTLYSSEPEVTFTATENLSLSARFDFIIYSVTVSVNNSNYGTIMIGDEYITGSSDGRSFVYKTSCALTAVPYSEEYLFKNWTENGTIVSTDNPYNFSVTTDRDIVANFQPKQYTLTLEAGEGGTVTGQGTYSYNTNVTIRATPNSEYTFDNWTSNGVIYSTSATEVISMTTNRSYKANFKKKTYTISLSASTGGTVSGNGTFEHGSTCIVTATPNSGYAFESWTEGSTIVSTDASYSFTVSAARTLKANFVKTYTITLQSGIGGYTSGQGTFNRGTTCTVVATPYNGYSFVNWTESGSSVSSNASYSFTVNANRTLKANFNVNTYTVTAEATAGGSVSGQGSYTYNTYVTMTATPSAGYDFVNWTENGIVVSSDASYSFYIEGNRALRANFTAKSYSVVLEASTGGTIVSGQGSYPYGTNATVVATPNAGYDFVSWTENGTVVSTSASYSFTVTAARALRANFEVKSIAIVLEATEGGSVSGQGTYGYGASVTVSATPNTNYNFVNWTENGTVVSTSASYTFTVTAERTLKANFAINTFAVTLETTTGGSVSGQGIYDYGTSTTVIATPNVGYKFVSWTENGTVVSTDASYTFIVNANRTLKANFAVATFSIGIESTDGGSVSGQGTYAYGTSLTVTATPSPNYSFVSWTENGTVVSTDASYTFTVDADRTLKANFAINTFSVTLESTDGGTVSGEGTYNYASNATVSATPNTGYHFVNWTENGAVIATEPSYTFRVYNDITLKANFATNTFSIALEATEGGTVSGQGTYSFGSNVTISAISNEGYNFVSWTEDGIVVSTDASYTFTVNSNRALKANFAIQSFTITLNASAGGTVSGDGSYNWGTNAVVVATPAAGYSFVNWTENGTEVSKDAAYSFTVYKASSLMANFKVATGISDISSNNSFSVYPNPAKEYVYVKLSSSVADITGAQVYLYDLLGKAYPVNERVVDLNVIRITLTSIPQGIYFVSIVVDGKNYGTRKIVVSNN